ncbi:MAG: hypothetical protein IPM21_06665 [Acidobacteria bacterium]|nr:hypothetical protein [Acidobacteriota bacterium]
MFRSVLIGVLGFILSGMLLGFAGWLFFNFSGERELLQALHAGTISKEEFAEAFFDGAVRKSLVTEILALPLVAIITGGFIGLLARERVWLPTLVGIFPVLFFVLEISVKGMVLSAIYSLLAIAFATVTYRWRLTKFTDSGESAT